MMMEKNVKNVKNNVKNVKMTMNVLVVKGIQKIGKMIIVVSVMMGILTNLIKKKENFIVIYVRGVIGF